MFDFFKNIPIPLRAGEKKDVANLIGASLSLFLFELMQQHKGPVWIVTESTQQLTQLQDELQFLIALSEKTASSYPLYTLPDWEILPYDRFSPHQDIISDRLKTLYRLPLMKQGILLTAAHTALHRLCPRNYVTGEALMLHKGQAFNSEIFRQNLESLGYYAVSQVTQHGEFAFRGSILDLFPMGAQTPYRIDLFDDEIDSLRTFDPDTQRTLELTDSIELLPAKEFPLNEKGIAEFKKNWRQTFEGDPTVCAPYQAVTKRRTFAGLEYYAPLFFNETQTIFDYLPSTTLVVSIGNLQHKMEQFRKEYLERYEQYRRDLDRPILPPEKLFILDDFFNASVKNLRMIRCHQTVQAEGPIHPLPPISVQANDPSDPWGPLKNLLNKSKQVIFSVESAGRREVLLEALSHHDLTVDWIEPQNLRHFSKKIGLVVTPFEQGFYIPSEGFACITEDALWGEKVMQRRRRQKRFFDPQDSIRNLMELKIGDPVVHLDHGIGRYLGLETLTLSDLSSEFLSLEYAKGDKLYVPIASLHLISRYSGSEHVTLHQLGNGDWQKAKRKSIEKIKDIAAELLELQAKRNIKPGISFDQHDIAYEEFANRFPFEETPDQAQAIRAVIEDMRSNRHMDRLVCGDVGFGKTEVALRAAFLAAFHGKQVAILVPTTLLAEQHVQTFRDRLAPWPIRVEVLSRFNSSREEKKILEDLSSGKVDVVIGTHKLLQPKVKFQDLGLLIIDEEHRFGVKHKEKFKALRSEVDILTLTATPIPRTLNMALSQIRDLSIIATPPEKRLSIKTFVRERDPILIREAILREVLRGGQVYFLHNNIQSIEKVEAEIQAWVPESKVRHAHGQMRETELERLMVDFYHQRFNVLVCTTIIETGIDIPTANTIIIDRADQFGLAQLHQLRGRVGRSHHQAYAYLFTPPQMRLSDDAGKRLDAISKLEDLGAGFTLAMQDLEIRGAGEFLGASQSGHLESIGYSLYMEYLEEAIESLKSGKAWAIDDSGSKEPEINLHIPALIPEHYLPDVHLRLVFYKRMNHAKTREDLDDIQVELIDRFGLIQEPTQNLFQLMALKQKARALGVIHADLGARSGLIEFGPNPQVNPESVIKLLQSKPHQFKLEGPTKIKCLQGWEEPKKRVAFLDSLFESLKM